MVIDNFAHIRVVGFCVTCNFLDRTRGPVITGKEDSPRGGIVEGHRQHMRALEYGAATAVPRIVSWRHDHVRARAHMRTKHTRRMARGQRARSSSWGGNRRERGKRALVASCEFPRGNLFLVNHPFRLDSRRLLSYPNSHASPNIGSHTSTSTTFWDAVYFSTASTTAGNQSSRLCPRGDIVTHEHSGLPTTTRRKCLCLFPLCR